VRAPLRKIVSQSRAVRRPERRMRKPVLIVLECGHVDIVGKTEADRGRVYCFDCFYRKPPDVAPAIGVGVVSQ
jgi:hypothetical protein